MPASLDRSTRTLRVLIVEDESRLRELLLEVIPDLGYPALAARSAEDARKIMEADAHDIVLLDLQLPLLGGMDFFEELRARWPQTLVIILTGFGDMEAARRAIHLDVVDFLSKPFHLNSIEVALERARRRKLRISAPSRPPEARADVGTGAGSDVGGGVGGDADTRGFAGDDSHEVTLADGEKRLILAALTRNNGNRTAAAVELGISRRTLHYRLNQYGKIE